MPSSYLNGPVTSTDATEYEYPDLDELIEMAESSKESDYTCLSPSRCKLESTICTKAGKSLRNPRLAAQNIRDVLTLLICDKHRHDFLEYYILLQWDKQMLDRGLRLHVLEASNYRYERHRSASASPRNANTKDQISPASISTPTRTGKHTRKRPSGDVSRLFSARTGIRVSNHAHLSRKDSAVRSPSASSWTLDPAESDDQSFSTPFSSPLSRRPSCSSTESIPDRSPPPLQDGLLYTKPTHSRFIHAIPAWQARGRVRAILMQLLSAPCSDRHYTVYVIQESEDSLVKIGYTSQGTKRRRSQHETTSGKKYVNEYEVPSCSKDEAKILEQLVLQDLCRYRADVILLTETPKKRCQTPRELFQVKYKLAQQTAKFWYRVLLFIQSMPDAQMKAELTSKLQVDDWFNADDEEKQVVDSEDHFDTFNKWEQVIGLPSSDSRGNADLNSVNIPEPLVAVRVGIDTKIQLEATVAAPEAPPPHRSHKSDFLEQLPVDVCLFIMVSLQFIVPVLDHFCMVPFKGSCTDRLVWSLWSCTLLIMFSFSTWQRFIQARSR